jgi:hypothetical protein
MTDHQDYDQPPWDPQQGYGQQYPQGQPWQPQHYDPDAHHRRMGGQPYGPQGQPPQGQPWPQPGYQPPQGPPGWQQPGYGQQPPWGPPPQPPQPPRKRHTARNILLGIGGSVVAIIAIAVAASGGGKTGSTGTSATSSGIATQAAQSSPSAPASNATSSAPPQKQTVTYIVTGSDADVTYGPSGSDYSGSVPMRITKSLGTPDYYAIDAQLQGDGTVSCQILVDGKVISQATASGGYNIASCEISQDPFSGNWEDTNQGT